MKLFGVIILLIAFNCNSQNRNRLGIFDYADDNYQYVSFDVDGVASFKEKGFNYNVKAGIVYKHVHVGLTYQRFDVLLFGYQDYSLNVSYVYTWRKFQWFIGGRYGETIRGRNTSFELYGAEIQLDYKLHRHWRIYGRINYDKRNDFVVSGADPDFRENGYLGIKYIF